MAGSPSFIARLSSAASGITSLYGDQRPAAIPAHAFQHGAGVRALHCYGKRDDSLPFIWQGHALKPVVVTAIFFFMAVMLAPTLGALIVIAILAASRFTL